MKGLTFRTEHLSKSPKITAKVVRKLLADKHFKDVFISECKDGPTWSGTHSRLDAWVLKRSWSPVTMIGYEIKVSRSDFVNDDKWTNYLPLCNQLYFVCPAGLIQPDELPPHVGLLCASKTGTRLYTKKKAARREVEWPGELMAYVIMSRSQIVKNMFSVNPHENGDKADYWRDWLATKQENRELGRHVAIETHRILSKAMSAQRIAESKVRGYEEFKTRLRILGINPEASSWAIEKEVSRLSGKIPTGLRSRIAQTINELTSLQSDLAKIERTSDARRG